VQASPTAPALDFVLDGKTQASDLLYGNASAYVTANPGSRHVQAIPVNSASPIFDGSVSLSDSDHKTVLLTGSSSSLQSVVLTDGGTTTTTGQVFIRVVNASAAMCTADVYLVPAGTGITGVTPVATNEGFGQSGGYQPIANGGYEVFMTSPGTHNILLDTGPINSGTATSSNWTLVILDGTSGGFSFTLLQDQ
jgi:hypothetical protein